MTLNFMEQQQHDFSSRFAPEGVHRATTETIWSADLSDPTWKTRAEEFRDKTLA